jgi:hypothetical protein
MKIKWLFEVNTYFWSTQDTTWDSTNYSAKVIPESFQGVTMRWDLGGRLIAPNDLQFEVDNADGALGRSDLEGYYVKVRLITDGTQSRAWEFLVKRAVPAYGKLTCYCVDPLQSFLEGTYPNTKHPKEVWPSDDFDPDELSDYCVPVVLGTAYIPIMSVNTGSDRYYVLGADDTPTYTVDEVQSPHDWPVQAVWTSVSYSFNLSNDNGHKLAQFIIADSTGDGSADANGLWLQGDRFLLPLVKFSRSDTSSITNPADWIEYILLDFGVPASVIDTGTGSTFESAATIYNNRGITWNGGFWRKENREQLLASLLRQCDSALVITDKIELIPFDKTSQETIDKSQVKELTYSPQAITQSNNDGARAEWPEVDAPQDKFPGKSVVPLYEAQSTIDDPSSSKLRYRFGSDSQIAQKAAMLHFAKQFLQKDRMRFDTSGTVLSTLDSLRPSQVITLNDTIFGASFDLIVDELSIKKDLTISINGVRLEYLEDWDDLTRSTISITGDSSEGWTVAVKASDGVVDGDVNWSRVQDDGARPEDNADVTADHLTEVVYRQSTAPSHAEGRLWIDTDNLNVYRSNGTSWDQIGSLDALLLNNAPAESNADATNNHPDSVIFYQSGAPSHKVGRFWVDTDNGDFFRSNGSSWDKIGSIDALNLTNGPAESNADVTANHQGDISLGNLGEKGWTSLDNKPKLFQIVSKGALARTHPRGSALLDESRNVLKSGSRSYNVSVYDRSTGVWDSHTTYDVYGSSDTKKDLYLPEISGTTPRKNFTAVDCTGLTKSNGSIIVDLKCDSPSDLSSGYGSQLEIGSGGTNDTEEWNIACPADYINITSEWKTFCLPLSWFTDTGGGVDVTGINWVRWYDSNTSQTLYIRNLKVHYGDPNGARAMASDLNRLDSSKVVFVFTDDEPRNNRLDSALDTAMYRCGASRSIYHAGGEAGGNFKYRSAYILVGIPGIGAGNGLELYAGDADDDADAWLDTTIQIYDGNVQLGGVQVRNAYDISYTDGVLVEDRKPSEVGATNDSSWRHPSDETMMNMLYSLANWTDRTNNFTASAFQQNRIKTATGGEIIMTLPSSPNEGDWVQWCDAEYNFGTNNFLINRNGNTIEGQTYDIRCDRDGDHGQLEYTGSTWIFMSGA